MMEQSIVFHITEKESLIDYPGKLSLLFFTAGCNFNCSFCHNALLLKEKRKGVSFGELKEKLDKARENWVDSVCITGGEPTLHGDELLGLIRWLKDSGFYVKLDTNGSNPKILEKSLPYLDYIAMDYKTSLKDYPKLTRVKGNFSFLKDSLDLMNNSDVEFEIRTTVINPYHDMDKMKQIALELSDIPRYFLQPFRPQETLADPEFCQISPTSTVHLEKIKETIAPYMPDTEIIVRSG